MKREDRQRRAYRALLRLLPVELRRDFGADMEQLFADRMRESRGGATARLFVWLAATGDVLSAAAKEWSARGFATATHVLREGLNMDGWMQDVRFGVRSLLRRPGFTAAAVTTLALGIAATVSIFSVVNSVLLQPLPYPDSERLVTLLSVDTRTGARSTSMDHPDVRLWQEQAQGVALAGYSGSSPTLTGLGDPTVLQGVEVTDGLMTLLGYAPHLGRDLRASDDVPDGPRVAVVSHRIWSDRLGRDPEVIGRLITLSGESWEIVGVAPPEFDFPGGIDVWLPSRHQAEGCGHGCRMLRVVGKLDPGTDLATVQTQFDVVDGQLREAFPDSHRDSRTELQSLIDYQVGSVRAALWVLFGAVGMVLLIACANVANLLLVRAQQRRGEVSLRATLGAGKLRLIRQLLTESVLLAVVAGALGGALAAWGTDLLVALAPAELPRIAETGIDVTSLGFTALLVVVVVALFGVMPAAHLARESLAGALGSGTRTAGEAGANRSRSMLLMGEVALSLSLLLGAGLLFRTMVAIQSVDLGFSTQGVERFRVSLPDAAYDSLAIAPFFDELEEGLAAIPGVQDVGSAFSVPFASGRIGTSFQLLDRPEVAPADEPIADIRPVTPGYLAATGVPLVRGRWFTTADRYGTEGVAVINETLARLHYPGIDPIGRRLHANIGWGFGEDPVRTIVGIVRDVRTGSATAAPDPAVYIPNTQFAANSMYVSMRLGPGVETAMPQARAVLRGLDGSLAITRVERIEEAVQREYATPRFYLTLLAVFSALAVTLAAVGLYGVVAFAVGRRTSEIGIRIALGADSGSVVGMVLRQGLRPAAAGIVVGLAVSMIGVRLLESLLYGVAPYDPVTVLGATALLAGVVFAATLLPARRASRIPPASALRAE